MASGGTLFLDEIGDMALEIQAKFLRILETQQFERLGGTKTITADVRIIAATNKDLWKMVEEKKFRQDLYYRINVFPIHIPPLRERKEDISMLCTHFIGEFSKAFGKKPPILSEKGLEKLLSYGWQGNIRELKNVLERAMILCNSGQILARHLILNRSQEKPFDSMPLDRLIPMMITDHGMTLDALENRCILYAMNRTNNTVSKAARILGISRATLRYRLEKLDINRKD